MTNYPLHKLVQLTYSLLFPIPVPEKSIKGPQEGQMGRER